MPDEAKANVPSTPTLTSEHVEVGDGHSLYIESVGRRDGIPAVYLHGGPGSGCQPDHRKLFDPTRFHAVLFDQRGCGRSRPKGGRESNTTQHLVADLEAIRIRFGFERWLIVGGSWGATLALAYAQVHPERTSGIVLRATFLGTREELNAAFLEALPRTYPAAYDDFIGALPESERTTPLDAYFRRILDPDPQVHTPAIRAWYQTERILSEHKPGRTRLDLSPAIDSRNLPMTPVMEAHYFSSNCFLDPNQLLDGASKLRGISGIVVQGRYDLLCPPATSHALAQRWPDAELRLIEGAGHSLYDPGVRDAVVAAINDLVARLQSADETNREAVC